jgi:hypothetical protein
MTMKYLACTIVLMMGLFAAHPGVAASCGDLDGARVWSQEPAPRYLGFFGIPSAADSIENAHGVYGSPESWLSVRASDAGYGSSSTMYSAANSRTTLPPVIMVGNEVVARLSTNAALDDAVSLEWLDANCSFMSLSPIDGGPPLIERVQLNQHGITGTWYDPHASGQGIVLEVAPDQPEPGAGILFGGWFTYDLVTADGKRWYSMQGAVSATSITTYFYVFESTGGAFSSAQPVETSVVGDAVLTLTDCDHALLAYTVNDGSVRTAGVIPLTRLLANATCGMDGDNGQSAGAYLLSGSWADPGASGQGLVVEINPGQGQLFAGWFTYRPDAAPNEGQSAQTWFSLQGVLGANARMPIDVTLYESEGGFFNAAAGTTVPVGSGQLQFVSCTEATLSYSFVAGTNAGQSGTQHLGRVVPVPSGCSLN